MRNKFGLLVLVVLLGIGLPAEAYQNVKIQNRQLVVDFEQDGIYEPYFIKGVGYEPTPIGRFPSDWGCPIDAVSCVDYNLYRSKNIFDDDDILNRDFQLLQDMKANTIRVWNGNDTSFYDSPSYSWRAFSKITQKTLDKAEAYNLKVIAGFYMPWPGYWECQAGTLQYYRATDYTDTNVRTSLKNKFLDYVNAFKSHSALLFWAIGNENNIGFDTQSASGKVQIQAYYSLVNEMAQLAHNIEGVNYHPVAMVEGGIDNVGRSDYGTTDAQLSALDIWGANIYKGQSFGTVFTDFNAKSTKPLWVSEYGVDSWYTVDVANPSNGFEDEDTPAQWNSQLYDELAAKSDVVIGGTIMAYSDEWWKPNEWQCGDGHCNSTHDYFGFGPTDTSCPADGIIDETPVAQDHFYNEEWWGIVSIAKNSQTYGVDVMTTRLAYDVLKERFKHPVYLNHIQMETPFYQPQSPYLSTGAAAVQMVIDFMRVAAGQSTITQNAVYQYAKSPAAFSGELTPPQIAKVLGHFDPYDVLVTGAYDEYDSAAAGNPYQGYNFGVEGFLSTAPDAINKYLRDICHWMAYKVRQRYGDKTSAWVAEPHTPAIVPIYGSYNNWVVINGYSASASPTPNQDDPFYTPNFTVYGFWITDPKLNGLGRNTYKSAAEVVATYFLPLSTTDQYNQQYVQIAEPPPVRSKAKINIAKVVGNSDVVKAVSGAQVAMMASRTVSSTAVYQKPTVLKKGWRTLVDTHMLNNPDVVKAFEKKQQGQPVVVQRLDRAETYYIIPFGRNSVRFMASAAIILNGKDGAFKEATWSERPEMFLKVNEQVAKNLVWRARRNAYTKISITNYTTDYWNIYRSAARLVWKPKGLSNSPFLPYWEISLSDGIWYVTQDGRVTRGASYRMIM